MPTHTPRSTSSELTSSCPVAIGGVGGSGTSIVARLVEALGIYIGFDLNRSYDNLSFTLLFRDPKLLANANDAFSERFSIFSKCMTSGQALDTRELFALQELAGNSQQVRRAWIEERISRLRAAAQADAGQREWGWKEPNTHLLLDQLYQGSPGMRYIHVLRHGLDVATSTNQRQRARWSQRILKTPFVDTPRQALQYWCASVERAQRIARNHGKRIHVLNFDELCGAPELTIQALANFLGVSVDRTKLKDLSKRVRQPSGKGRYRHMAASDFDPEDLAQVRAYGFEVDSKWLAGATRNLDHSNAGLHFVQSNLFANSQDWRSAIASGERAVTLTPHKPRFRRALCELYFRNGEFRGGEHELRNTLRLELDQSGKPLNLGPHLKTTRALTRDNQGPAAQRYVNIIDQLVSASDDRATAQFQQLVQLTRHTADREPGASARRISPCFLVLGAQRCGTTSLFQFLQSHPQIQPPVKKEVHFFDNRYSKGLDWYLNQFPERGDTQDEITGEATPYYLFHPFAAARVKAHFPHMKLIVILRNPADRAYSHYKWAVAKGNETLPFEDALNAEQGRLDEARPDLLCGKPAFSHQKHSYRSRGRYLEQLNRWLELFPNDQFLFLRSEDFFSDPEVLLAGVWAFLGISPHSPPAIPRQKPSNEQLLDPRLRQSLQSYYQPFNQALESRLGVNFNWR